jgi:hypothetical protein
MSGEKHPDALTGMANLASIFKGQGRDEEAMALLENCTRMRNLILGPNHSFTISSQNVSNEWRLGNLDSNPSKKGRTGRQREW